LPLITAGAFSKGWIVWGAYSAANGGAGLWVVALAGVFLTALYTFRMIFLVFFGQQNSQVTRKPGHAMVIPCLILAFFSIAGGYIRTPFASYLSAVLPWNRGLTRSVTFGETFSEVIVALVFFLGLCLAYVFFLRRRDYSTALASSPAGSVLDRFWFSDWGMDWLYDRLFVRPVVWMAKAGKGDLIDGFYAGVGGLTEIAWRGLSRTESGKLRWYAAVIAGGTIVLIAVVIFS
jgi:NADH-quinone oxidoreductase subunit L